MGYCFVAVNVAVRPFNSTNPVIVLSADTVPEKFHSETFPLALAIRFHCQRIAWAATVPVNSPLACGPVHDPVKSPPFCRIAHTGRTAWDWMFHDPEI